MRGEEKLMEARLPDGFEIQPESWARLVADNPEIPEAELRFSFLLRAAAMAVNATTRLQVGDSIYIDDVRWGDINHSLLLEFQGASEPEKMVGDVDNLYAIGLASMDISDEDKFNASIQDLLAHLQNLDSLEACYAVLVQLPRDIREFLLSCLQPDENDSVEEIEAWKATVMAAPEVELGRGAARRKAYNRGEKSYGMRRQT